MTVEKLPLLNIMISEKYRHKSTGICIGINFPQQYWHWYRQYLIAKVLVIGIDSSQYQCSRSLPGYIDHKYS